MGFISGRAVRRPWGGLLGCLFLGAMIGGAARSDEGMWPFHSPPIDAWKSRYKFEPNAEWLTRLQHASVRFTDGGSGSFLSEHGLILTNQHVARSQVHKLSHDGLDLVRDGFYARTLGEELRCPDMEASVLESFEDVSTRVRAAVAPGAKDADANAQRKSAMATIEKECASATGLRCEVVTLYGGGQFWLYRYRRYTDVRLVFTPEEQAAAFGGEYDNFTYPRYAFDFTLLRVYDQGRPLSTPQALRMREKPVEEGELVIVSGHPATTSRGLTVAQLRYHRDVLNPLQIRIFESRLAAIGHYEARGEEEARRASATRNQLENQLKRLRGQEAGLRDTVAFARKEKEEQALRDGIAKRPELRARFGDAFGRIATAYQGLPNLVKRQLYSTLHPSRLAMVALALLRHPTETAKPEGLRFEEFRESRLPTLRLQIMTPAPFHLDFEEAMLADWLEQARVALGDRDPFVVAALGGRSAKEVAHEAMTGTSLNTPEGRKATFESGAPAMVESRDPLIALVRRVDPVLRELRILFDDRVQSVETAAGAKIAEARFALYGNSVYPDATFTLRLGFGQALGYEKDTRLVPYQTLVYGLFDRALSFRQRAPYNLAPRIDKARSAIDPATPLNFVYTADTIGGNSGSPVVDRNGDVVGLNFDSNLEKLPNRYYYVAESSGSRAVAVHSAAIVAALEKIYGATALARELLPQSAAPMPANPPTAPAVVKPNPPNPPAVVKPNPPAPNPPVR